MILAQLIAKWQASQLTERSAAQSHFLDLCRALGQPEPSSDPTGENYAFEKSVSKVGGKGSGRSGFADVWRRDHFAWEYKGKKKNLADAYDQLLQYREELGNPPLLVVCDLNRFEVHTNFTNTAKRVFAFTLADLARPEPTPTCALPPLDVLRALFEDPNRLRPEQTTAAITQEAARGFGRLALSLQAAGHDPHSVSRFLIRVLFCLFAEDVGLLPPNLFTTLVEKTKARPGDFAQRLSLLFAAMADGGGFGADDIKHFNGGLFNDAAVLPMTPKDLAMLAGCARLGWENIEPSIFGTLFERSLDPAKRSQLGAHYTSREDILLIVEPVLMTPLRRRWAEVQTQAQALIEKREAAPTPTARTKITSDLNALLQGFSEELAAVRVLDPACGSGNFLYVALRALLDLEKDVITFAIAQDSGGFFPRVGPEQMRGMEINDYAHELAPITVWIGYIQWLRDNGFGQPAEPILRQIDTIQYGDAVLAYDDDGRPAEPAWPEADVIIGNPPFLGGSKIRKELGDRYISDLFRLYEGRVPGGADLVTYWFERARALIEGGTVKRSGLLTTDSIRGGANRKVLERIKESGDIFLAWADRPWVLDGAAVRVSMVGFDNGTVKERLRAARNTEAGCLGFALFLLGLAMTLCLSSVNGSALCLYGGLTLLILGGVSLIPCFDLHRAVRELEEEASSEGSNAVQGSPPVEPQQIGGTAFGASRLAGGIEGRAGFRTHHACQTCGLVLSGGDIACRNCKQPFSAPVPGATPHQLPAPTASAPIASTCKAERGWVEVAQITGKGDKKSPPFEVGERWRVEWDTKPNDEERDGFVAIQIYRVKGNEYVSAVAGAKGADRDSSEEYGAGHYYLKISSSYQTWTVQVFNEA